MHRNGSTPEAHPVFPAGCPDTRPPDVAPEVARLLGDLLGAVQRLERREVHVETARRGWWLSWTRWPWQRDAEVADLRAKLAAAEIERDQLAMLVVSLQCMVKGQYAWAANCARMMGWNEPLAPQHRPQS